MWGHVEHLEQLWQGPCQHCLHQVPTGGGGSTGGLQPFYDEMDGGW